MKKPVKGLLENISTTAKKIKIYTGTLG